MGKKKRPVGGGWGSFRASFSYSFFFSHTHFHSFLRFAPFLRGTHRRTRRRREPPSGSRVGSEEGEVKRSEELEAQSSGLWNNYFVYCYIHVLHRHRMKRNFLPSFLRLLFLLLITGWLVIVRYNMTLIDDSLLYKLPSIKNEWMSEWMRMPLPHKVKDVYMYLFIYVPYHPSFHPRALISKKLIFCGGGYGKSILFHSLFLFV